MEPIPDTGGGISGFLARLIWDVNRYFPLSGMWDWLVLIMLISLAILVARLSFLWRLVERDMQMLEQRG